MSWKPGHFVLFLLNNAWRESDEGQPRPKFIFKKCGTNTFLYTVRFGASRTPNIKWREVAYGLKQSYNYYKRNVSESYLKSII